MSTHFERLIHKLTQAFSDRQKGTHTRTRTQTQMTVEGTFLIPDRILFYNNTYETISKFE